MGSAIAVSAGLAPISVGTETDGSLVTPSNRASLYTLKPTHGFVSAVNIIPTSARYDTAGPIGKTVKDVADLLTILVDHSKTDVLLGGYASAMTSDWGDIKVGTLDPEKWRISESFVKPVASATEQMVSSQLDPTGCICDNFYISSERRCLFTPKFEYLQRSFI